LTSPSEIMREKWRHDRETSNSVTETYFCKNVGFFFTLLFFYLHLMCAFANILLISFIFNFNSCFVFSLSLLLILYYIYWFSSNKEGLICWHKRITANFNKFVQMKFQVKIKSKNIQTDASCIILAVELCYIIIIWTKLE
jgi:hypothetical protein